MPLKMALAAGWSSCAYDVQQLMRPPSAARPANSGSQTMPSPLLQSHTPVISPVLPASLESRQHLEVAALPVPLVVFFDVLSLQKREQPRMPQPLASGPLSSPNPPPCSSQSTPRLPQELPSSSGISRAFQLRNDSDVLVSSPEQPPPSPPTFPPSHLPHHTRFCALQVRLILRDDQGGGEGFCHVDTLLASRIVFPALRRG
jgi:hypothetical protein